MTVPADLTRLGRHLAACGRVMLGYSGGVDSALLAVVARRSLPRENFLAVIGRSASYPEAQYQVAVELAERFDLPLHQVATAEVEDPAYRANTPERCFFCKTELWQRLGRIARERGFDVVIDGTNADDVGEHRPGLRAAAERGVRSPLLELGWTKARVRAGAQALGLPIWDAPAAPCLASRVRYGLEVTPARLRQVEQAEELLRRLGVRGDLRVRHHGTRASVEVGQEASALVQGRWSEIERDLLALGFAEVVFDPRGYRRGGLLPLAPGH